MRSAPIVVCNPAHNAHKILASSRSATTNFNIRSVLQDLTPLVAIRHAHLKFCLNPSLETLLHRSMVFMRRMVILVLVLSHSPVIQLGDGELTCMLKH
jgi:hypothetical protein